MKELLEIIIKGLVDNKESVAIYEEPGKDIIGYRVKVDKNDMGHIIGRQGKMAKSIRTVMKSVATKEHKKVNIEFMD